MGITKRPVSQPVLERLGSNVKRLRSAADLNQVEFAAACGMAQSTVSRIEMGSYPALDVDALVRIALAARCSLGELLDGVDMAMEIVRFQTGTAVA